MIPYLPEARLTMEKAKTPPATMPIGFGVSYDGKTIAVISLDEIERAFLELTAARIVWLLRDRATQKSKGRSRK